MAEQIDYEIANVVADTTGYDVAEKVWSGEKFLSEEILREIIDAESVQELKIAVAAALKVAIEKGKIASIPAGTDASVAADIASITVDSAIINNDVTEGRCTPTEGFSRLQDSYMAVCARSWSKGGMSLGGGVGTAVGSFLGSFAGPTGVAVGAVLGGALGNAGGYAIGGVIGFVAGGIISMVKSESFKNFCSTAKNRIATIAKNVANSAIKKINEKVSLSDSQSQAIKA